jgi:hypothetical protein
MAALPTPLRDAGGLARSSGRPRCAAMLQSPPRRRTRPRPPAARAPLQSLPRRPERGAARSAPAWPGEGTPPALLRPLLHPPRRHRQRQDHRVRQAHAAAARPVRRAAQPGFLLQVRPLARAQPPAVPARQRGGRRAALAPGGLPRGQRCNPPWCRRPLTAKEREDIKCEPCPLVPPARRAAPARAPADRAAAAPAASAPAPAAALPAGWLDTGGRRPRCPAAYNFDHPDAFDTGAMLQCLLDLKVRPPPA